MQAIVQHLGGDGTAFPVWAAVLLAGLAVVAILGATVARRHRAARAGRMAAPARIERGQEWDLVVHRATQDLWRGPELADLHADAQLRIESAEHAYNRVVADCAKLCDLPVAPTVDPASQAPAAPEEAPAPERAPLAA